MLRIVTSRFGALELAAEEIWNFPQGLIGLEGHREWALLGDAAGEDLAWLQATSHPELALPVVSPRRFVRDFRLRVAPSELVSLRLCRLEDAQVLVIVGRAAEAVTLNLKAPVILNPAVRLGRQVVAGGDQPLRHNVTHAGPTRRAA